MCASSGPRRLGYAGGIQLAFHSTRGEAHDIVAVLNPDVVFLPGSVAALVEYLEDHPRCGAVAPITFLDEDEVFRLPAIPLPTAKEEACAALEPRLRWFARHRAATRTRRALGLVSGARANEPREAEMLSGACLFLPRAVAESIDPLLDPEFPLYYEGADLCRRLKRRGFELAWHPATRVLHHWSRSAGAGPDFEGEPMRRHALSRASTVGGRPMPWSSSR